MSVYFLGKGAGDIYIKAECTFVSERYSIQDLLKYDDATTDKSSGYDLTNFGTGTITHHNDGYYILTPPASANTVLVDNLTVSNQVKIEFDVKINATYNGQIGLVLFNSSNVGVGAVSMISPRWGNSQIGIRTGMGLHGLGNEVGTTSQTHTDWHHISLTINGSSITAKFIEQTVTATYSTSDTGNKVGILCYGGNSDASEIFHFKNLKIQEL